MTNYNCYPVPFAPSTLLLRLCSGLRGRFFLCLGIEGACLDIVPRLKPWPGIDCILAL